MDSEEFDLMMYHCSIELVRLVNFDPNFRLSHKYLSLIALDNIFC